MHCPLWDSKSFPFSLLLLLFTIQSCFRKPKCVMYVSYNFLICRISHFLNNHVLRFQVRWLPKMVVDFLPLFSLLVFLMNLSLLLTFLTSVCLLLGFVGSFLCMQRQYTLSNATNFLKKVEIVGRKCGKRGGGVTSPLYFFPE